MLAAFRYSDGMPDVSGISPAMRQTFRTLKFRALLAAAASLPLLGLAGCGQVNGGTSNRIALLRIVDASPDAGNVDIYLNSTAAAYNLGFGSVSSYFPISPATYTLSANTAGTHNTLTSVQVPLTVNTQSTLLIGNVASGLQSTLLTDQGKSAPFGQVSVRFVNEATRTGAVDIYFLPAGTMLTSVGPVVPGISFGQVKGYLNVPAGSYSIAVLPAGTVPSSTTVPLYSGNQINLPGSNARTVIVLDSQLMTQPAAQIITLSDYDSPNATS